MIQSYESTRKLSLTAVINCFIQLIFFMGTAYPLELKEISLQEVRENSDWEVLNLDIRIDISQETPRYSGTLRTKFNGEKSFGPMIMLDNRSVSMSDLHVDVLESDKLPRYTIIRSLESPNARSNQLVYIEFNEPFESAAEIEIEFSYYFEKEQGQLFSRPADGFPGWPEVHYASWVTGWFPYLPADEENLIGVGSWSATGKTEFILPADLQALTNGKLTVNRVENDIRKQVWQVSHAVARSYVVAPYTSTMSKVGTKDVGMYLLTDDPETVKKQSEQIVEVFEILEQSFGAYPYDTFALAEIPDGSSDYFEASSEQGFIVAGSSYFRESSGLSLFAHEAGHAWWGNMFSCTGPGRALCSEGLAQVGALLTYEALFGASSMRDLMDVNAEGFWPVGSTRGYFAMWRSGYDQPISTIEYSWKDHRIVLTKGQWFWLMLREEIGEQEFHSILKNLAKIGETMSLDQLEDFFSNESEIDLEGFFEQWLYRTGTPILNMDWSVSNKIVMHPEREVEIEDILVNYNESPKTLKVVLNQEQEELYDLDVEIGIEYYYKPTEIKRLTLSEREIEASFEVEGYVKDVTLDPARRILMWRPAYGPKPSGNIILKEE